MREDNRPQRILSVKRTGETPPIVAVLIQDNLVSRVSNEIRGIKSFICGLPEGSRVITGYISIGSLRVTQDFTTDRERAAASLRILVSSQAASPFSPYEQVLKALRRFDAQPQGRRMMLLVSDGLDVSRGFQSASPALAAEEIGEQVGVVVSRGGRPDLAGASLPKVKSSTLLIVGGRDEEVITLNWEAYGRLHCEKKVEIVDRATHLFEEPGTLEEVARLAAEWFNALVMSQSV